MPWSVDQLICGGYTAHDTTMESSRSLLVVVLLGLTYYTLSDQQQVKFQDLELSDPSIEMKSKRAFHDTPYGQIHYKYGGDFDSSGDHLTMYTFLLFHGNPRSTDEFKELIHELANRFSALKNKNAKFSYIAMDLLGEGHSDDPMIYNINPSNGYVSMEQYAEYMIEIASKVFEIEDAKTAIGNSNANLVTRYIVPLGSLTGSAIATELSYQLALKDGLSTLCKMGNCKVLTTILHDPMYYFTDQIVTNVHSYANMQRAWQPKTDGQHLTEIWNDLNYQPYKDLALQDRKSLDRYRAASTQWQVILSYADYSSKSLLGRLTALSKLNLSCSDLSSSSSVFPLLIIYGGEFLNDATIEKLFEVKEMRGIIADATKGGMLEKVVDGGNQALLSQNVTVVADMIMEQLSIGQQ